MSELSVINKAYEIYKTIDSLNYSLDKRRRYSLGVQTETLALELLKALIKAKHAPRPMKPAYLIEAIALTEVLRLELRLYLELKLANETKIFQIQAKIAEAGRMLGGWKKSLS